MSVQDRFAGGFVDLGHDNVHDLLETFHLLFHGPTQAGAGEADGISDIGRSPRLLRN